MSTRQQAHKYWEPNRNVCLITKIRDRPYNNLEVITAKSRLYNSPKLGFNAQRDLTLAREINRFAQNTRGFLRSMEPIRVFRLDKV